MKNFCTITTFSHLYKTYALADSLKKVGGNLKVLLVDNENERSNNVPQNISFYYLKDLNEDIALKIQEKYPLQSDALRWSLKPVFLTHLLKDFDKMIYVDNDIYFYNDAQFLFDELDQFDILLTPHHYPKNPEKNQNWLEANFKVGLYNAGFIASNKKGVEALNWWAKCCLYRCEKNTWRGLWDDQKYLDLMPIAFSNVKVLTHKGCNVAEWNKTICKRVLVGNDVLINEKYPIVFYHFNGFSIKGILNDKKHILKSYFENYFDTLKIYKPDLKLEELYYKTPWIDKIKLQIWQWLNTKNDQTLRK